MTNLAAHAAFAATMPGEAPVVTASGTIDISLPISTKDIDLAWNCLGEIMKDDPSHKKERWKDRDEQELKLLAAVFWRSANLMPMSARNYIQWLDAVGQKEALWDSALWQLGRRSDEEVAKIFGSERLQHLTALAKTMEEEHVATRRTRKQK